MTALAVVLLLAAETTAAPLLDGNGILSLAGILALGLGTIAVFLTGANNRIDSKRESELTRLGDEVGELRGDIAFLRGDVGTLARIAVRAVRSIQSGGGVFPMTEEEQEALERTRPLGEKIEKEGTPS